MINDRCLPLFPLSRQAGGTEPQGRVGRAGSSRQPWLHRQPLPCNLLLAKMRPQPRGLQENTIMANIQSRTVPRAPCGHRDGSPGSPF